MKKTWVFSLIVIGTIIGAGFATGREVSQYFARFGYVFIPCALLAGMLFYFFYVFLLRISREKNFVNYQEFSKKTFGKFRFYFDAFLGVSFLVLCGSMYASINQVQRILFDFQFPFLSIATAVMCVLVCLNGLSGLSKANIVIIPPIIIFITIICIKGILENPYAGELVISSWALPVGLFSCILYVLMNFLLAGIFLLLIGNKYNAKQSNAAIIISITVLTVILILICICLLKNSNIMGESVPLLVLSFSFSKVYGYIFCIIIWFAVFSTLISASFSCLNILSYKNQFLSTFSVVIISYFISAIGFTEIVKYIYPVIGMVGFVFCLVIMIKYREHKINIFYDKNTSKRKIRLKEKC